MSFGDMHAVGFTSSVGLDGMSVHLSAPGLEAAVEAGTRIAFRLVAWDHAPALEGVAELAWSRTRDLDAAGRPVVTLGLHIIERSAELERGLARLMDEFRHSVLVVDDQASDAAALHDMLAAEFRVVVVERAAEAVRLMQAEDFAVVVAAERIGSVRAVNLFEKIAELLPRSRTVRIVASDYSQNDQLHDLVNRGNVFHLLRKPYRAREPLSVVRRAVDAYVMATENERLTSELELANERLARENTYLRQRLVGFDGFEHIVGRSPALRAALDEVARIRRTDTTVHLRGETGTGKELVARALHFGGPRAKGPFVTQNCAGMTESLLQSTLFGYRKGAFTGADRDQPGVFQAANGGTLFLDEVADLTPMTQASLLRVLQDGEVMPVGASRPERVSVRIVSATHKDLRAEVQGGRFREDLYFRLVVIAVALPPLRDRHGDIPFLARHFLDARCEAHRRNIPGFTPEAMKALERYRWPGNVRELENAIERLVVLAEEGHKIPLELLTPELRIPSSATPSGDVVAVPADLPIDEAVDRLKRELLRRALVRSGGKLVDAATAVGMERTRFSKLRRRLGMA